MHVNPNTHIHFTYHTQKSYKKISLFEKVMEPLRATLGSLVWKQLGRLNLSPEKKAALQNTKNDFISKENAKSLTITVNDVNGQKTHQLDGIAVGQNTGKYTVVFFGLKDCYEKHLESMKKLSQDTGTTVVSINYRGTCDSTGTPDGIKDYIADGKALIEYLKGQGVEPKNIVVHGHSLGGGVAAGIGHTGLIISENSFSNFKLAVKDKKGAFTAWIIKKTGWNINSVKALKTNEQLCVIVNRRDLIIDYKRVSLYKALQKKYKALENKHKALENKQNAIKVGMKNDEHQNLEKEIKKAGLIHLLRNSHAMLMDQPKPEDVVIPQEIEKHPLASKLGDLNKLYAKEDQIAYQELVKVIKTAS